MQPCLGEIQKAPGARHLCLLGADDSLAGLKLHARGTLYNARSPAQGPCGSANGRGSAAVILCSWHT